MKLKQGMSSKNIKQPPVNHLVSNDAEDHHEYRKENPF